MEPLSTKKFEKDRNMRESSKLSYMTEVMNPQIWEKIPEDLLEFVIAQLPIATIIRFRTVCKQWNNLITSQSFSQHCAQVSQANQWFYITFGNKNFEAMYDPFMKRWYYPNTFETFSFPVSSAGGLCCFHDNFRNVYVCNPWTKSFKKLPAGSVKKLHYLGMTGNESGGYKVLKLGYDREYEIYDSETKNWGNLGMIPSSIQNLNYIIYNPISIDNTLYFKCVTPKVIISCNTSTGVWTKHLFQAPLHSFCLALAESDGRIMLVGMLNETGAKCLCIWEVQKVTFLLKEVDRWSCSEFNGSPVYLYCLGGSKDLLLCCLQSRNMFRMVSYNIATTEWVNVCVPYGRKLQENYINARGIVFQPCLTAMP